MVRKKIEVFNADSNARHQIPPYTNREYKGDTEVFEKLPHIKSFMKGQGGATGTIQIIQLKLITR